MVPAQTQSSARLGLPYLQAGQMQKHVTLNEALTRLDVLVQTVVASRSATVQPESPEDGRLHVLPEGAEGPQWSGFETGDLVRHEAGVWSVVPVAEGLTAYVLDEARLIVRGEAGWIDAGVSSRLDELEGLGIGTSSDEVNIFAAKLNAALWTARTGDEGGTGDLRSVLNKESGAHVLSLLFQSGWSGRAEIGLVGDEDLTFKVSPDGVAWRQGLGIDRDTGAVRIHAAGNMLCAPAIGLIEVMGAAPGRRRAFLMDDLITTLIEAGVWDRLDVLYVMAAADEAAALINWRAPGVNDLTAVAGPEFRKDMGFKGDGTGAYLSAGAALAELGGYALNDATLFSWSLTHLFENGRPDLGASSGTTSSIYPGSTVGNLGTAVNGANINTAVASSAGLSAVSRVGDQVTIFKDGASAGSATQASGGIGSGAFTLLRAGTQYSSRRLAAAGAGRSLDQNQHRILHHALKRYLAAVGAVS